MASLEEPRKSAAQETYDLSTSLKTSHNCTIEIENGSEIDLEEPDYYTVAGHNRIPPPPTIRKRGCCVFTKPSRLGLFPGTTAGVISYKYGIRTKRDRFAIMWKVTWGRPDNAFAVAWLSEDDETDDALYRNMKRNWVPEMHNHFKRGEKGRTLTLTNPKDGNATLKVTMSDNRHAIMRVEFTYKKEAIHSSV